ncbi:hypothetical protein PUNSTDRAFT_137110 [Punctularia strigosozonata HHB-11173 SS5]|uniref:uncharacterized protein n=1 Tax=Punctularia strigosozonata (strain HHB-11173) TaxID=741275 RepID=UPI0004417D11|nr:uncharacterized protein PUNSTDRAFT_137110 [Punctularia strigosozonata HHB-11173 SS5]EIN06334.1 hypothetical protein PUNSTDRAFT_137110 [Punctularia strigosozonata HHB-11173 SS5]
MKHWPQKAAVSSNAKRPPAEIPDTAPATSKRPRKAPLQLPQEILEEIIDEGEFKAWSLVCKSMLPRARANMFHNLYICNVTQVDALISLPNSEMAIFAYVRVLKLCHSPVLGLREASSAWAMSCLPVLLQRMPMLRCLHLIGFQAHDSTTAGAIHAIRVHPHLTSITFRSCESLPAFFFSILSAFSRISFLTLDNAGFIPWEVNHYRPPPRMLRIDALCLNFANMRPELAWLKRTLEPGSLQELRFISQYDYWTGRVDCAALTPFCASHRLSLRILEIKTLLSTDYRGPLRDALFLE